jgi:amino acid transporter
MSSSMQARSIRWLSVLWPAFMVSIPMVGILFSAFDPAALRWTDSLGEPLSPLAVYSLGFLVIWALVSMAVAMARSFPPPADPVSAQA